MRRCLCVATIQLLGKRNSEGHTVLKGTTSLVAGAGRTFALHPVDLGSSPGIPICFPEPAESDF